MHSILKLSAAALTVAASAILSGCGQDDARVASANISQDANNFRVERRIVFVNGMSDKYLLEIEGRCSLGDDDKAREISVTCKTGPGEFKKHFLGLSDNVTFVVEQLAPVPESVYHYRVTFKPETLLNQIDMH